MKFKDPDATCPLRQRHFRGYGKERKVLETSENNLIFREFLGTGKGIGTAYFKIYSDLIRIMSLKIQKGSLSIWWHCLETSSR